MAGAQATNSLWLKVLRGMCSNVRCLLHLSFLQHCMPYSLPAADAAGPAAQRIYDNTHIILAGEWATMLLRPPRLLLTGAATLQA